MPDLASRGMDANAGKRVPSAVRMPPKREETIVSLSLLSSFLCPGYKRPPVVEKARQKRE